MIANTMTTTIAVQYESITTPGIRYAATQTAIAATRILRIVFMCLYHNDVKVFTDYVYPGKSKNQEQSITLSEEWLSVGIFS
jgi:hypothetical protein